MTQTHTARDLPVIDTTLYARRHGDTPRGRDQGHWALYRAGVALVDQTSRDIMVVHGQWGTAVGRALRDGGRWVLQPHSVPVNQSPANDSCDDLDDGYESEYQALRAEAVAEAEAWELAELEDES